MRLKNGLIKQGNEIKQLEHSVVQDDLDEFDIESKVSKIQASIIALNENSKKDKQKRINQQKPILQAYKNKVGGRRCWKDLSDKIDGLVKPPQFNCTLKGLSSIACEKWEVVLKEINKVLKDD